MITVVLKEEREGSTVILSSHTIGTVSLDATTYLSRSPMTVFTSLLGSLRFLVVSTF